MNQDGKCFACGKPFRSSMRIRAYTEDGQEPFVGPECWRRICKAHPEGYQPKLGGPKLYQFKQYDFDSLKF